MRKLLALLTLSLGFLASAFGQDTARFVNQHLGPNSVFFDNQSTLNGTFNRRAHWFFGDGARMMTGPQSDAAHLYSSSGIYNVCLKIYRINSPTDSVLTGQFCDTVQVQLPVPPPDSCGAQFTDTTASGSTLIKRFVAQSWHSNGKRPEQICWSFGDGQDTCINYNPAQNYNYVVEHAYAQAGNYNVCVTIRYQGGCVKTYCRMVNAGTAPVVCGAAYVNEPVTATPLARRFIALPSHSQQRKPVGVCWIWGDGTDTCIQYSTSFNGPYAVNHTYAGPGQYNVCVKIIYDGGCQKQSCSITTIAAPPAPVDTCFVNIAEVPANLYSTTRQFYAGTVPNKVPYRICWYFGDGTDTCINLPNPAPAQLLTISHQYPGPGVYQACVRVWYDSSTCVAYRCREVRIQSPTNLCGGYITDSALNAQEFRFRGFPVMNPSDAVISWFWSFGDGTSATGQNVVKHYGAPGNYLVCLTIRTSMGCETKICKRVSVAGTVQPTLVLTPNPVTTNLHAVFQSILAQPVNIGIYNSNGVLVRSYVRNAAVGSNAWDFDVATLPAGIYSVKVSSANQFASAIFFKQ